MKVPRKYTEAETQWEFLLWAVSLLLAAALIDGVLAIGIAIAGHWPDAGAVVALLLALGSVAVMLYAVVTVVVASVRTIIATFRTRE